MLACVRAATPLEGTSSENPGVPDCRKVMELLKSTGDAVSAGAESTQVNPQEAEVPAPPTEPEAAAGAGAVCRCNVWRHVVSNLGSRCARPVSILAKPFLYVPRRVFFGRDFVHHTVRDQCQERHQVER